METYEMRVRSVAERMRDTLKEAQALALEATTMDVEEFAALSDYIRCSVLLFRDLQETLLADGTIAVLFAAVNGSSTQQMLAKLAELGSQ